MDLERSVRGYCSLPSKRLMEAWPGGWWERWRETKLRKKKQHNWAMNWPYPGAWARAKEVHLVDGGKSLRAGTEEQVEMEGDRGKFWT